MNKVKLLPPDVISKIAAGEVVDRPGSVIKELVENSIDAGATHIDITLQEAGKTLIQIKDNGCGIVKDDLKTIFLRHATSKIREIDDLESLASLGFRGEALYSIAAISDIELKSQAQDSDDAWLINMRGGVEIGFEPSAPIGVGTEIKINELFFNTPARKKFLKSNVSEMNQILNLLLPHTFLHPNIHFTLKNNDKKLFDLPAVKTRAQRFALALGVNHDHLIEDEYPESETGIKLSFVLGNINLQRRRRDQQYLFVNGRPVEHKSLMFHCNDIYRLIFPPGVYPVCAIFINLPADQVDANIHPTKREVKIREEGRIFSKLRHCLEQTLMTKGQVRSLDIRHETVDNRQTQDTGHKTHETSQQPATSNQQQNEGITAEEMIFGPRDYKTHEHKDTKAQDRQQTIDGGQETIGRHSRVGGNLNNQELFDYRSPITDHQDQQLFNTPTTLDQQLAQARHIGNFANKYQLFELGEALFLIDQHAAQERIMFETFRNQINDGDIEVQNLLTPYVIKLTPQERVAWEEANDDLKQCGFETTQFDEDSIAVQTAPVLIKKPEQAVQAILAGDKVDRCNYDIIARRACKASVVTGDRLNETQALFQRDQLLACQDPFTCPHGRPTVIEMKLSFIDRQFLRT